MLAELLRKPEPRAWGRSVGDAVDAEVSEGRLPLVLLAQIAADREQTMSEATWRNANPAAARWFTFLGSTHYTHVDVLNDDTDRWWPVLLAKTFDGLDAAWGFARARPSSWPANTDQAAVGADRSHIPSDSARRDGPQP